MLSCRLQIETVAGGESGAARSGSGVTVKQFPNFGRSIPRPYGSVQGCSVTVTTWPDVCAGTPTRSPVVASTTDPPCGRSMLYESQSFASHDAPLSIQNELGRICS